MQASRYQQSNAEERDCHPKLHVIRVLDISTMQSKLCKKIRVPTAPYCHEVEEKPRSHGILQDLAESQDDLGFFILTQIEG